jgi:hypothetical protein
VTSAETAARFLAMRSDRLGPPPIARAPIDPAPILSEAASRGFVETWKRIGVVVDRSERWCRYMATVATDPLPVFMVGGFVRLNLADLEAWLGRQRDAEQAQAAAPHADLVAGLRAEITALRAEVVRLTEIIMRDAGTFTEAQIAAVLEVKRGDRAETSHA